MKYKKRRFQTVLAVWRKKYIVPKNIGLCAIFLVVFLLIGPFCVALLMQSSYSSRISQNLNDVKPTKVGIIFSDAVDGNSISDGVEERIQAAVDLYKSAKISKLLISGDSTSTEQNNPQKMLSRAAQLGIPKADIMVDGDSKRTYDSCNRAKNVSGLNEALLISQTQHLSRALYICNSLGLRSTGYAAHVQSLDYSEDSTRQLLAFLKAIWDVNIAHPQ